MTILKNQILSVIFSCREYTGTGTFETALQQKTKEYAYVYHFVLSTFFIFLLRVLSFTNTCGGDTLGNLNTSRHVNSLFYGLSCNVVPNNYHRKCDRIAFLYYLET